MAKKVITYSVENDSTLTPNSLQDGGIQGEHKMTELKFVFSDDLYKYFCEKAKIGKLIYRFDGYDGAGNVYHSNISELTEKTVCYKLENFLTRYGGLIKVVLTVTLIEFETGKVLEELVTAKAELRLIFTPYSISETETEYKSLSSLAETAKLNAETATVCANKSLEALNATIASAKALNGGSEYIFDGGDVNGEVDVNYVIDSEVSDYSENAVSNKAIKQYIDNKVDYAIGSIWVGGKDQDDNPLNPADIFGGEWKLIDKEFSSTARLDTENSGKIFTKSTEISEYEHYAIYGGHTIRIRFGFKPKISFDSDDAVKIGDFIWKEIGITGLYHSLIGITALSDVSNGLVMANIDKSGTLTVNDVIKNTTADQMIYINKDITCRYDTMLDSFCDKFYWQKIS